MVNPRLAGRYAKSLADISIEKNQLEEVYQDVIYLQALCNESRDLVNLLKSPIIQPDKKLAVLEALTKGKVTDITSRFIQLVVKKGRENVLREILQAFVDQYKRFKDIHTVKLVTAVEISEELKHSIVNKIKAETPYKNIELKTEVKPEIIGGFVLEVENSLIDASIAYDLNAIKKQFDNNDFIYKIR